MSSDVLMFAEFLGGGVLIALGLKELTGVTASGAGGGKAAGATSATTTGAALSGSGTLQSQIMTALQTAGLSKAGAAGVVGNLQQESSLNPDAPGGGLAQWIGSRWTALTEWAGTSTPDATQQVTYLIHEMQTDYPSLWQELTSSTDPAAAALAVSQEYERPGVPDNANRERYADEAYNQS